MLNYIAQFVQWSFLSIFLWILIAISSIQDTLLVSTSWLLWLITVVTAIRTFISLYYILIISSTHQITNRPTNVCEYLFKLFYCVICMFLYDTSFGMFKIMHNNPRAWHTHLHIMIHLLFVAYSYCIWKKLVQECITTTLLNTIQNYQKSILKSICIAIHPFRSYSHHKMYQSSFKQSETQLSDLQSQYNEL